MLFIAAAFPPLNSSGTERAFQFARRLPEHGWLPIVITLDWAREPLGNPLDFEPLEEFPSEIPIYRIKFFNPAVRFGRWLHRRTGRERGPVSEATGVGPLSDSEADTHGVLYRAARKFYHFCLAPVGDEHIYWSIAARRRCKALARRFRAEAIFVSLSPWSVGLLGLGLRRSLGLPLVVDFRDYWTQWPVRDGPRWRDHVDRRVERRILKRAERIVCVHPAMMDDFIRIEPLLMGRCHVITNGFDRRHFEWPTEDAPDVPVNRLMGPLLVHAGIAWGDAALPLVMAVARSRDRLRDLGLVIKLVGGLSDPGRRLLEEERLEDLVEVTPRVPHKVALGEMRNADGLLLLLVNNEGGRKWYPGKLFEYFAARKPIITIGPEGIATQLVRRLGAGITLDPGDIDVIAKTLAIFAEDPEDFRLRYFSLSDEALLAYERNELAARLAEILNLSVAERHEA